MLSIVLAQMIQRYAQQGCPNEFPVRTKCIALFQKIRGIDTMLFAMYVYEYGHECPAPNKRRVYISYLDSVQYFEPKCYRTTAYHAIIIEYLRYVKKRGFHTAHIWSCPPTPGDDYIFYCHPKHQLVPREDMLRTWYYKMLDQAKIQGVVIRTTTLYDEYFTNDAGDSSFGQPRDPTCLPYFEGDYIPGEIENIIQHLENEKHPGASVSHLDTVMARLGHNLGKMKENFIVVHLRNRRFAAAVERGEDVSQWKEDSDDEMLRSKRAKISGKSTGEILSSPHATLLRNESESDMKNENDVLHSAQQTVIKLEETEAFVESCAKPEEELSNVDQPDEEDVKLRDLKPTPLVPEIETRDNEAKDKQLTTSQVMSENVSDTESTVGNSDQKHPTDKVTLSSTSADVEISTDSKLPQSIVKIESGTLSEGVSSSKRTIEDIIPILTSHRNAVPRSTSPVGDTSDEDPPLESEMFESRQQFLNYCQTTHCQFDELRRAKHSTVMVLFQLHNPTAPKFLQQCCACYRDITHGIRYHCNNCSNFDLCDECYKPVTSGEWAKRDARFAHVGSHKFTAVDMEVSEETQNSRAERQKSLKTHVELLEHAGKCDGAPGCSLQNCQRMKKLFLHVPNCEVKPKRDCKVCTRLLCLCTMHARMCTKRGSCPIPFCDRIRERNMRLRRQQQLMDDRRRQAQNELYRAGDD
jgi:Histone acetylation protein/Zinc finger, ZZ type